VFQFFIGCVVGLFAGFMLFVALIASEQLDIAIATNTVIAIATVVATIIHFSSIKQQRKDRIWDINKPILLDLSHTLSLVIKASEFFLQCEYASNCLDDQPDDRDKPGAGVYKDFEEKQEYALNVYKALMDKELIEALANAKRISQNIDHGVTEHGIDLVTAYEQQINVYRGLQEKLDYFIAEMSGVKDL